MGHLLRSGKIIGLSVASLVGLLVLSYACVWLRKSMPYVFASDIEQLAASGPYNSREMATEVCGAVVDAVGSADTASPEQGLPKGTMAGWRPLYPVEGLATVRVTGVGFVRAGNRSTGRCTATMTFRYRFAWADNGRAVVLESRFVDRPSIAR